MLSFEEYNTNNPLRIPNNVLLKESMGVPNILKDITTDIYTKIINNAPIISLDITNAKFNIRNLYVSVNYHANEDIYATSKFGIFAGKELQSPSINIWLNNEHYDETELKRVILHELLHIYEIYNRIQNKAHGDKDWKLNKILQKIRSNYTTDKFLNELIFILYISFDHEINARIAEVYQILVELNTTNTDVLYTELKKSKAWQYKSDMLNIRNMKYDRSVLFKFFKEFNTLVKKNINTNNSLYKIPSNENDAVLILNKWFNIFEKKSKYFEKKMTKVIAEVINDVKMLESAYVVETNNSNDRFITKYDKLLYRNYKINTVLRNS